MDGKGLVDDLKNKLGDDEEALLVLASLAAAWAETTVRLAITESKLLVAGGLAARGIAESAASLSTLGVAAQGSDAAAAEFHKRIMDRLSEGAQLATKASGVMADVLQEYSSFSGNVSALKGNAQSLVLAAINSIAPGAGAAISGPLARLLD